MRIGTLKETYVADAALFDSRTQKAWLAAVAAALVLFLLLRRATGCTWPAWWHQCRQRQRAQHPHRLHRPGAWGQAAFMGLGRLHRGHLQARWGTPFLLNLGGGVVAMLGGIGGRHPRCASRACTWPSSPSRPRSSPHFLFANFHFTGGTAGWRCRRRSSSACCSTPRSAVLADRAGHRADAAGRGEPVPHAHRARLHRHPRPRHLGRGAGHSAAARSCCRSGLSSFYAGRGGRPVGVLLPRGDA